MDMASLLFFFIGIAILLYGITSIASKKSTVALKWNNIKVQGNYAVATGVIYAIFGLIVIYASIVSFFTTPKEQPIQQNYIALPKNVK